jgi:hypothetical protein
LFAADGHYPDRLIWKNDPSRARCGISAAGLSALHFPSLTSPPTIVDFLHTAGDATDYIDPVEQINKIIFLDWMRARLTKMLNFK